MLRKTVFRSLTTEPLGLTTTQYFSHLNSADFEQAFKQEHTISVIDQLNNYQHFLTKHNLALRKPHQKLRIEEQRIIQKCLKQQKYTQTVQFLFNNSRRRLCNLSTVPSIDQTLANQYQLLKRQQRKMGAFSLISFRQQKVFKLFKKQVQNQIISYGIQTTDAQSLFIYLYGQIIKRKNTEFVGNLLATKTKDYNHAIQLVYQYLFHQKYKGIYQTQYDNLLTYLQLLLNPSLNKIQELKTEAGKQRSHLQFLVQSFLKVLNHANFRECTINNYKIDFLLDIRKQGATKSIALQVNGNYHYTLDGKLKGRQILRNLIINKCVPLRIVHQNDFLTSKGHRNKLAYIQNLLTLKDVNWQSKNEGFDSGWQVSQVQKMAQFHSK